MRITNDIFEDGFQYRLLEARFLDVEDVPAEGKVFEQIDKLENIVIDENERSIEAYFSRTIRFSPMGPFEITISFIVKRIFIESANPNDYSLEKLSDEEINEILAGTMSRASAVISSITGLFTNGPLITPPVFITEEE